MAIGILKKLQFRALIAAAALGMLTPGFLRADRHGGIEIGARGVKAIVLDAEPNAEGDEIKVVFSETNNTVLSAGLARSGTVDEQAMAATAAAVKTFLTKMKSDFKVKPERIYIVGSSGLFSAILSKPDLIKTNQKVIAEAIRETAGCAMTFIDARREAELSIVGIIPRKYANDALLVDIGSGNTKGGFFGPRQALVTFSVPLGTQTFHEAIKKSGGDYSKQACVLRESELQPKIRKALASDGGFGKKPRVILSGGSVWATTTLMRPADRSAYTKLTVADFDALEQKLLAADKLPAPDLSGIEDPGLRKAAEGEFKRVAKTFNRDQLLAGVQILKALAAELELASGEKQLCFARNGYLGWILAYVSEKMDGGK